MTEKFARLCTATNQGMNEGYCFNDGEAYFISESHALKFAQYLGYKDLGEAYEDEAYYYTDWEVDESDEWYEQRDGKWYLVTPV